MIYTKHGSEVEIVTNFGEVESELPCPATLVEVRYLDHVGTTYQFDCFLRADGGMQEIDEAVKTAPSGTFADESEKTTMILKAL